jgi:glycosyltransferase involved in cell wall biosynthesis
MSVAVSVIIPCHNSERFLKETLKSVYDQTFKDFEIILVDDGSTDATRDIISAQGDKVQAQFCDHAGASVARNRGTSLAHGKFLQYLDSDDLLKPDALEKRVEAIERTGADVAYSDWQKLQMQRDGSFQKGETIVRKIEDVHSDLEIALFTDFWAPPAALLYTRGMVDRIGGWNESLPVIQDARFLQDAGLKGGRFVYVPGITAVYRVHSNDSLSRRDSVKFTKDIFTNASQIEEVWRRRGELSEEQKKALVSAYGYVAHQLFMISKPDFDKAYEMLQRLDPSFRLRFVQVAGRLSKSIGYPMAKHLVSMLRVCFRLIR